MGWSEPDEMLCTEQASAVLLLALMGSRAAGVAAAWQEPFQLGVYVLGTNCLFLAGIIRSSIAYAGEQCLVVSVVCKLGCIRPGCAALQHAAKCGVQCGMSCKYVHIWVEGCDRCKACRHCYSSQCATALGVKAGQLKFLLLHRITLHCPAYGMFATC